MDDLPASPPPNEPPNEPPPSSTSPTQDPRIVYRCTSCGAGLRHQRPYCIYCGTRCPDVPIPTATPTRPFEFNEPETPTVIPPNALCRGCGYSLDGLKVSDNCPECGKPVLDSIRGDLLKFAEPTYLQSLHRGAVLVETGLIAQIVVALGGVGLGALQGTSFALAGERIASIMGVIPSIVLFVGWYMLSTPDPGIGLQDKGDKPRQRLRIAVIVNAIASIVAGIAGAILPGATRMLLKNSGGGAIAPIDIVMACLVGLATLTAFIAFIFQFFSGMSYLDWISRRVPDMQLAAKMKKQTWTIALLYCPGCILCGIGPLISLVLFYNLLDVFRKHFKAIRLGTSGSSELWVVPTGGNPPSQSPNSGNNP